MSEFTGRSAAEVYAVHVQLRDRGPLRGVAHRLWGSVATLVNGLVSDRLLSYPETGEIVVADRMGMPVLRLPVSVDTMDATLEQVEVDLAVLPAGAFLGQWQGTP